MAHFVDLPAQLVQPLHHCGVIALVRARLFGFEVERAARLERAVLHLVEIRETLAMRDRQQLRLAQQFLGKPGTA